MAESSSALLALSSQLADAVAQAALSVVRVDDNSRLTATGIVWDNSGLVLATSHGVESDENIWVELRSGKRLPATLVGRDEDTDLALMRVAGEGLVAIERAGEDEARVGSLALALGRPGQEGVRATLGIVSARTESQRDGRDEWILHTDAALLPGFSGGPLISPCGRMLGLVNRGFGRGGIALGVPILEGAVESLLRPGSARQGYLGISTQAIELPASLRQSVPEHPERALLIANVQPGSAAESSGILPGDIMLALDGVATADAEELRRRLRALSAGDTVALQVLRGGEPRTFSATLGAGE